MELAEGRHDQGGDRVIREAIEALVAGRSLTREEAAAVMQEMMSGEATPAQMGAFLTALRIKGEDAEEIAGMAQVMREKALRVQVADPLVDVVGTGGDGQGTFNISTAAALVVAGAGLRVAKHGNRAMSSACGSADVLEACGVKIDLSPEGVQRCIEEVGIGFMFAPRFHPSMRHAVGPRREIGIRTVFNILGPLTNPAGAQHLLVGVAQAGLAEKMAQVLLRLGTQHALVVHGDDGFDELTLGAPTQVWEVMGGTLRHYTVSPEELELPRVTVQEVKGGTPKENAAAMEEVLRGKGGPVRHVVALNAAAALMAGDLASDLRQGLATALAVLDEGVAYRKLQRWAKLSQALT